MSKQSESINENSRLGMNSSSSFRKEVVPDYRLTRPSFSIAHESFVVPSATVSSMQKEEEEEATAASIKQELKNDTSNYRKRSENSIYRITDETLHLPFPLHSDQPGSVSSQLKIQEGLSEVVEDQQMTLKGEIT